MSEAARDRQTLSGAPWADRNWRRHPKGCCKRVVNQTAYDTRDLTKLIGGAFTASKRKQTGGYQVRVYYSRTSEAHGRLATLHHFRWEGKPRNHWLIELAVTKNAKSADINHYAGILMSLLSKLANSQSWWQHDTRWSDDMRLESVPPKPKPTMAERVSQRAVHAGKMLERAERDLARANARVIKWSAKVKYYDKQEAKR